MEEYMGAQDPQHAQTHQLSQHTICHLPLRSSLFP